MRTHTGARTRAFDDWCRASHGLYPRHGQIFVEKIFSNFRPGAKHFGVGTTQKLPHYSLINARRRGIADQLSPVIVPSFHSFLSARRSYRLTTSVALSSLLQIFTLLYSTCHQWRRQSLPLTASHPLRTQYRAARIKFNCFEYAHGDDELVGRIGSKRYISHSTQGHGHFARRKTR